MIFFILFFFYSCFLCLFILLLLLLLLFLVLFSLYEFTNSKGISELEQIVWWVYERLNIVSKKERSEKKQQQKKRFFFVVVVVFLLLFSTVCQSNAQHKPNRTDWKPNCLCFIKHICCLVTDWELYVVNIYYIHSFIAESTQRSVLLFPTSLLQWQKETNSRHFVVARCTYHW